MLWTHLVVLVLPTASPQVAKQNGTAQLLYLFKSQRDLVLCSLPVRHKQVVVFIEQDVRVHSSA